MSTILKNEKIRRQLYRLDFDLCERLALAQFWYEIDPCDTTRTPLMYLENQSNALLIQHGVIKEPKKPVVPMPSVSESGEQSTNSTPAQQ